MRRLGFGLLALLVFVLFALNALAWTGGLVEEPEPAKQTGPLPAQAATKPEAEAQPIARKRPAKPKPKKRVTAKEATAKPVAEKSRARATLAVTATRGDCWVEVRTGSPEGQSLYSGILALGNTVRFDGPQLWLRLGAASHVDVVVNGRPSAVPPGTVELSVPA